MVAQLTRYIIGKKTEIFFQPKEAADEAASFVI
jgi:hypothetical protein